uniref:Uncharacterized protein n=1 Tax=Knipowitschia caucasica TaxID=637954 RepID=A0AAV2KGS8_KNICA
MLEQELSPVISRREGSGLRLLRLLPPASRLLLSPHTETGPRATRVQQRSVWRETGQSTAPGRTAVLLQVALGPSAQK